MNEVQQELARIRGLPWRGIEIANPKLEEAAGPGEGDCPSDKGAAVKKNKPRQIGPVAQSILDWLKANPGWQVTGKVAKGIGTESGNICGNIGVLLSRGLVQTRKASVKGRSGRPGKAYRYTGLLSLLLTAQCCQSAGAHDLYTGLQRPDVGGSCCNNQDCRPTSMCVLPEGKEGINATWGCIPVPYSKVVGMASPDGRPHICELSQAQIVLCVVMGVGA
jgi:hypothetical protein